MKINTNKYAVILLVLFSIISISSSAQPAFSIVNNGAKKAYISNLPYQFMHFYLFGDGYYSKENNPTHAFPISQLGYLSRLYFVDEYDDEEPELSLAATGQISQTTSNRAMTMGGPADFDLSWAITDYASTYIILRFQNLSNATQSGCIEFNYSSSDLLVDASNILIQSGWASNQSTTTNQIKWNFSNLKPNEQRVIYLPSISKVTAGNNITYSTTLKVNCSGPGYTAQKTSRVSSYPHDPNYKKAVDNLPSLSFTPELLAQTGQKSQWIDYDVQFHNDGNGVANSVIVKDFLDQGMIASSVHVISSTHQVFVEIVNSSQVNFVFNKIKLPGYQMSGVSLAETIGKFTFRVCFDRELEVFDCVENKIDIHFDNQPPISAEAPLKCCTDPGYFQNVCEKFVAFKTSIDEYDKAKLILLPNPAFDFVEITCPYFGDLISAELMDMNGSVLNNQYYFESEQISFNIEDLKAGVYFVRFVTSDGTDVKQFIKM